MTEMSFSKEFADCDAVLGVLLVDDTLLIQNQPFQGNIKLFGAHLKQAGFYFFGCTERSVSGNKCCSAGMGPDIPGANVRV